MASAAKTTTNNGPGNSQSDSDTILKLANNLSIRRFRHSDCPRLARLCDNRKLWRNMRDRWPQPYDLNAAHSWVCHTMDQSSTWLTTGDEWPTPRDATKVPGMYAVAKDDEVVGSVGLHQGTDVAARTAELGYWVAEEHWGNGIASEAVKAFVEWAFTTFGWLVRLHCVVFEWNPSSMRVMEKVPGFEREGVQKGAAFKDGQVINVHVYGKVRDEYK